MCAVGIHVRGSCCCCWCTIGIHVSGCYGWCTIGIRFHGWWCTIGIRFHGWWCTIGIRFHGWWYTVWIRARGWWWWWWSAIRVHGIGCDRTTTTVIATIVGFGGGIRVGFGGGATTIRVIHGRDGWWSPKGWFGRYYRDRWRRTVHATGGDGCGGTVGIGSDRSGPVRKLHRCGWWWCCCTSPRIWRVGAVRGWTTVVLVRIVRWWWWWCTISMTNASRLVHVRIRSSINTHTTTVRMICCRCCCCCWWHTIR